MNGIVDWENYRNPWVITGSLFIYKRASSLFYHLEGCDVEVEEPHFFFFSFFYLLYIVLNHKETKIKRKKIKLK